MFTAETSLSYSDSSDTGSLDVSVESLGSELVHGLIHLGLFETGASYELPEDVLSLQPDSVSDLELEAHLLRALKQLLNAEDETG